VAQDQRRSLQNRHVVLREASGINTELMCHKIREEDPVQD
jgi:hypothetical protein